MTHLISMREFVLQEARKLKDSTIKNEVKYDFITHVWSYATFLSKSLTLSMFVATDQEGKVMEPFNASKHGLIGGEYHQEYEAAKSRVLFSGFSYVKCDEENEGEGFYLESESTNVCDFEIENRNIESLWFNWADRTFKLTPTALKEIGTI